MSTQPGTKRKRFLAPQEKYEIWMQLVRGETTVGEAADFTPWLADNIDLLGEELDMVFEEATTEAAVGGSAPM